MSAPILVSAPGKIILTGEHAVVYGHPALVAPLQRRTYVRVGSAECVRLTVETLNVHEQWSMEEMKMITTSGMGEETFGSFSDIHESTKAFLHLYSMLAVENGLRGMDVTVKSDLILGAGLGSSASFSVSLSAALLLAFDQIQEMTSRGTLDVINDYAFKLETLFHGKPSGADNTTCCYGDIRCYGNKMSGGKACQTIDNIALDVLVVNTGVARSTRTVVQMVREQYDKHGDIIKPVLDAIGVISSKTFTLLKRFSVDEITVDITYKELSELIEYNQKLLETLRVSHAQIERICETARQFGLGAKLTGAGGGGCVFVLMPPGYQRGDELRETLLRDNPDCFRCELGGVGVRVEDAALWDQSGGCGFMGNSEALWEILK